MKIAYLGYDVLYPCLTALEAAGCSVMEIFTCKTDNLYEFNLKVSAFAERRNIPCHIERITLDDIHRLKDAGCQAIFCAGYFYKVPVDRSLPIVNVHPAMLPIGRGAWPMPVVIMRGLTQSGVTLHKMEKELDAGDILLQRAFPVTQQDNLETLTETVCEIASSLCARIVANFDEYWDGATPQGDCYEYWACPQKEDYTITQNTPPNEAEKILRAFYGFDCYIRLPDNSEICVSRAEFLKMEHTLPFGSLTEIKDRKGYAATGGVILEPVHPERKSL